MNKEINQTCCCPKHGPSPIPQEGKWTQVKEITQISGLSHGVGGCAPRQGACKLTINVKDGIIVEALVEMIGWSEVKIVLVFCAVTAIFSCVALASFLK